MSLEKYVDREESSDISLVLKLTVMFSILFHTVDRGGRKLTYVAWPAKPPSSFLPPRLTYNCRLHDFRLVARGKGLISDRYKRLPKLRVIPLGPKSRPHFVFVSLTYFRNGIGEHNIIGKSDTFCAFSKKWEARSNKSRGPLKEMDSHKVLYLPHVVRIFMWNVEQFKLTKIIVFH